MPTPGAASASATERFRQRFASCDASHFRPLQDLWASSIGLGTYLGDADDHTDSLYREAVHTALAHGCNVLDTAINYRCQRSERTIGRTLAALITEEAITREEVILCTKGGYVPFDQAVPADPGRYLIETFINTGIASYEDMVAGCHCLAPTYLEYSLQQSMTNLRVRTIDVYYLHNPEQQLDEVSTETFLQRMERAFAWLEQQVRDERMRYYGVATWNGFRVRPQLRTHLSLPALVEIAKRVGGTDHHFRVIQLPYNLAMPEAFSFRNQTLDGTSVTLLEAATQLGLSVMISASLLQSRLASLPDSLAAHIPGPLSAAQRALQFVRSTPGVTTALVGMKQRAHVEENLALTQQPLLDIETIRQLFDRTRK